MTADHPIRRERILNALCCALIVTAVFITFGRLFNAQFTNWDDAHTVVENKDFKPPTFASLAGIWSSPRAHLYVPVTYSTWWTLAKATYRGEKPEFIEQQPRVFHAANIALHAAAACVVFAMLRRLNLPRWAAFFGALVFALHPVQVEPVAWVSGLKDVLCGLLSVLALWQYIVYAQTQTTRPYVLCLVAFVLAMLSKPTAAMFPLMALAIDTLVLRRTLADIVRGVLPLALFSIPTMIAASYFQDAGGVTTLVPIQWRPIIALDAIACYLAKIVWPINLALDYGRHPQAVLAGSAWKWTVLVPIIIAVALVVVARKTLPPLLAGAALFIATLVPLLGLKPFDFQQYSTVADHYLYMPMIGVALIVAFALSRTRAPAGTAIGAAIVIALAIRTFDQTRHWRDSEALWTHTIQLNPESWVSYLNLGEHYVTCDQTDRAIDLLTRSIALRDNDPAHLNLGVIYLERKQLDDAIGEFERAIALKPRSVEAYVDIANAYGQAGRFDDSIKAYRTALALDPKNEKARNMLRRVEGYVRSLQTRPTTAPTRPSTREHARGDDDQLR